MTNRKQAKPVRRVGVAAALLSLAGAFQFGATQNAAAGTSTPYQEQVSRSCPTGTDCALAYTAVPASSRLDIQMVGCDATGADGSGNPATLNFQNARVYLQSAWNGKTIRMPINISSTLGQFDGHYYNTEMSGQLNFSVQSGQQVRIFVFPNQGIFAKSLTCAIVGQMVTLP